MAAAEARRASSRLLDRVRDRLTRRLSRSHEPRAAAVSCWICGKPATLWAYLDGELGVELTDGYPTCAQHFIQEAPMQAAETHAS